MVLRIPPTKIKTTHQQHEKLYFDATFSPTLYKEVRQCPASDIENVKHTSFRADTP